jgi:tRNA-splicing ligase RtcB
MRNDIPYFIGFNRQGGRVPIYLWTTKLTNSPGEWEQGNIEPEAMRQLENLATLPFVYKHIAAMPDVHWGNGTSVGTVIATKGAVIPAAVGVDIGCGMLATRLSLTASDLPDNLFGVRSAIEAAVPHGRTNNGGPGDRGAWGNYPVDYGVKFVTKLDDQYTRICEKHPKIAHTQVVNHLGTLGTGNHFIELCLDEEQRVWIMLHSGSRGIGAKIGAYFIAKAKEDMERWFVQLPDANLAYLPEGSENFADYMRAVGWAQDYAMLNRELMLKATFEAIKSQIPHAELDAESAVNCHHNYVSREYHYATNLLVTRKGAVRARLGDLGIIPGSMGARSYIVKGKGAAESFTSCSHGAGRRLSRTEAKKRFTIEDHKKATEGIECRKDAEVIDETPAAYKSIDEVMASQSDLVEIVHTLRQVVCVKG